ncbi:MAG: DM13 domain-containing protein [Actinomycetota bacterium]|nr:DM13 domain-containing protein [Actinomycetota bacterium]
MRLLRGLLAAVAVAVLLLAGVWIAGGRITNDFGVSMVLTGLWIGLAGLICLAIGVRSRELRLPVIAAYVVTAGALGAYLSMSVFLDDEVDETVVMASEQERTPASSSGSRAPRPRNVLLSEGSFRSLAHPGEGRAQVIDARGRGRFLTLTDFEVDNGPDLRVYLVRGRVDDESDVVDYEDLGALKGNKGDQQYEVPEDFPLRDASVVIWCRAFSVAFASAALVEA